MAKTEKEFEAERAADTLLEAKEIKKNKTLHVAALAVIVKRQNIQTLVLKDN